MFTYLLIPDGPATNLFSVLCILIQILSHAHTKGEEEKNINSFKLGAFIGRLLSDGAASMAVKGLRGDTCMAVKGLRGDTCMAVKGLRGDTCMAVKALRGDTCMATV